MSDWILAIEGTEAGTQAAMILALIAAVAHASLGALQKGRYDPWLSRGAIDLCAAGIAAPLALFVVPVPGPDLIMLFPAMMVIHLAYKWVLAMAYTRGDFTAVYPVVRGTGPIATVVIAGFVFGEHFSAGQWAGVVLISGGIFALGAYNLRHALGDLGPQRAALALAVATGLLTALYTVYDAHAIRQAADPFTFIVWFFLLEGLLFPLLLLPRWRATTDLRPLFQRGIIGALIAFVSFGGVFLATRLDKVGEAAALRETSVIFAALIGWLLLGERLGLVRAALMVLIALGAVLVEFA